MAISQRSTNFTICVVGGGLVGLSAALRLVQCCDQQGGKLALIAPVAELADKRTTAMMMPSIEMLDKLGVWEAIKPITAPLKVMRLIDSTNRLVRAPITDFKSAEIELEAFGYNVPNADMGAALRKAIDQHPLIEVFHSRFQEATIGEGQVVLKLEDGSCVNSQLVVAADGRNSQLRQAAGIKCKEWAYPQSAIVLNFSHSLPHGGISTEFHTETGAFTQVPLPSKPNRGNRSSLVWMVKPQQVDEILAHDSATLSNLVEKGLHSCIGKCEVEERPVSFAMRGMTASAFGQNRIALVGESGHVFPPVGAQGFNLGLRDVEDLARILTDFSGDPGSSQCLNHYDVKRRADVRARSTGVDIMNRSLLTSFLPVQMARAAGLTALRDIGPLRRFAMRRGMGEPLTPVRDLLKDVIGKGRDRLAANRS